MIKALMFNKLYHPFIGGVERHVHDLCEEIKGGVELKVLATNTKFKTEVEQKDGYQVIKSASLGTILSSVHLGIDVPLWLRRIESDIIHFHFPSPIAEVYCLMLYPQNKPLVITYHADIVGHKKLMMLYAPFLNRFLKRANRIIVSSQNMLERSPFLCRFKYKCVVIPYGIQIEKFKLTKEIKAKSEEIHKIFKNPIVLFVGRLVSYKGVNYLISAMEKINATLLIIGKGPQEKNLKYLSGKINSQKKKIFFAGEVSDKDLPAYYYASHLLVLPSIGTNEAFGIVQLEAQACFRPVVSTDLPTGISFANLDGITGRIVPARSAEKLAGAINSLLNDDSLRQRLGEAGKRRVQSEFSRAVMGRKILEIYHRVIAEN